MSQDHSDLYVINADGSRDVDAVQAALDLLSQADARRKQSPPGDDLGGVEHAVSPKGRSTH
jgi:hypothetical protein